MPVSKPILLLTIVIALILTAGCGSSAPLPEGELPNDFLFAFTYERLTDFGETVEMTPDGEVVRGGDDEAKKPDDDQADTPEVKAAPPPKEAAADGDEAGKSGENLEKAKYPKATGKAAPPEENVTLPLPSEVKVTVDIIGRTDIEVTHVLPRKNVSKETITISKDDLMTLYELIRAADLYNMPEFFEDGDWKLGKEIYFVIGRNKPVSVTVTGTTVPALTKIKTYLLTLLPRKDLLTLPAVIDHLVIMDRRSGLFYRADEEAVKNIPTQYRKEYKDPWQALNDGGHPSPTFGPLPKEWD